MDEHRVLPRFYRRQQELESERKIAAILLDTGRSLDELGEQRAHLRNATPVDTEGLRGIPAIGRGVAGASPGTNPLAEALRNEHRRERRRDG